jgi:CDP-diacylglycerol--glycerol-3-phosphate 3-phosphatidyltransferase
MTNAYNFELGRLRRQWIFLGIIGGGCLAGGACLLVDLMGPRPAGRWFLQAALVLAWVFFRLGGALGLNHPADDPRLRPSLGAANRITLLRAVLTASLAGFLFQAPPADAGPAWSWLPGLLYLTAAVMDYADGLVARATGTVTRLGEYLDAEIDALGLLVASLLLVSGARAPLPYLWVGFGYYGLQAAIRLRRAAGRAIGRVAPRPDARWVAGCQMGFAAAGLLPAFGPEATWPAAWVMAAGLFLSLGRDWLVVCGYADPDGKPRTRWLKILESALAAVLPVMLRAAVAAAVALSLWGWPAGAGMPLPPAAARAVWIAGGALCVLGVAARCAAMVLSLSAAAWLLPASPGIISAVTLAAAIMLMLTGAGRPRLCQPEDRVLMAKVGKREDSRWKKHIPQTTLPRKTSAPWKT